MPQGTRSAARAIAETRADPRVKVSAACLAAVETLRSRYDMPDASPFSYLGGLSPYLNLCAEPPRFLDERDRPAFEPVAFFGSLAPELRDASSTQRPLAGASGELRVSSPSAACSGATTPGARRRLPAGA